MVGHEARDPPGRGRLTLFIDSAVLMYAGGTEHDLRQPCQEVLAHVAAGRLPAVTSAEVVQEILHRFTALRLPELGVQMASACLDLFSPVLPVTHAVMARMPGLIRDHPDLAARDLVHVATCIEEGISMIVSPDQDFDRVSEVRRISPDDADAMRRQLIPPP